METDEYKPIHVLITPNFLFMFGCEIVGDYVKK